MCRCVVAACCVVVSVFGVVIVMCCGAVPLLVGGVELFGSFR